ncbi:hypothetical protein 1 [Cycas revoluta sobemo-like virus]|nr:hypothetical protein 1 [Cycas revoluta sobemo-like virus]
MIIFEMDNYSTIKLLLSAFAGKFNKKLLDLSVIVAFFAIISLIGWPKIINLMIELIFGFQQIHLDPVIKVVELDRTDWGWMSIFIEFLAYNSRWNESRTTMETHHCYWTACVRQTQEFIVQVEMVEFSLTKLLNMGVIVLVIGLVSYKLIKMILIYTLNRIKVRIFGEKPKPQCFVFKPEKGYYTESMMTGNAIMPGGKIPKGQVSIAVDCDGSWLPTGSGLRVEDYLIFPTHLGINGMGSLRITNGDDSIDLENPKLIDVCTDITAVKLSQVHWSALKVKKIDMKILSNCITVAVTSSEGKYSIGSLRPSSTFGRVVYNGSTLPGFSGSAYTETGKVVGIHTHGGSQGGTNGGYEIMYLYAKLMYAVKTPPEASEDLLFEITGKGKFSKEILDEDYAIVRSSAGHIKLTKQEALEQMERTKGSSNWADIMDYEEAEERLEELGYEPEATTMIAGFSGESHAPSGKATTRRDSQKLPASNIAESKKEPQLTLEQISTLCSNLPCEQLGQITALIGKQLSERLPSTSQLRPTQKPSLLVSKANLKKRLGKGPK